MLEWKSGAGDCYAANPKSHLVSIHDMLENSFVAERVLGNGEGWIGLWKRNDGTGYGWSDGSPVNYTNWCEGEPQGDGQRFVYISRPPRPNGCWLTIGEVGYTVAVCEAPDTS